MYDLHGQRIHGVVSGSTAGCQTGIQKSVLLALYMFLKTEKVYDMDREFPWCTQCSRWGTGSSLCGRVSREVGEGDE